MGVLKALSTAASSTLSDQWLDIVVPCSFNEHEVVIPAVIKNPSKNHYSATFKGVISKGSKIYVPENIAAFVFNQTAIETVVTTPGSYEYDEGMDSVFSGGSIEDTVIKQASERFRYGGTTPLQHEVAYVNLREIRDIKFGTKGPLVYNDRFYGVDLEIYAYGSFTIKVVDPVTFIRNFVPAGETYYSFDDLNVRSQLLSEF